jgi:hypothetical protein
MKAKIELRIVKTFDLDLEDIDEAKERLYDMFLSEELDLDIMEDYDDVKISVQRWV